MYGTFFSLLQYSRFWVFAFRYYYPISNFSTIMQRRPLSLTVQQIVRQDQCTLFLQKWNDKKMAQFSFSNDITHFRAQSTNTVNDDKRNRPAQYDLCSSLCPFAHVFCWLVYILLLPPFSTGLPHHQIKIFLYICLYLLFLYLFSAFAKDMPNIFAKKQPSQFVCVAFFQGQ